MAILGVTIQAEWSRSRATSWARPVPAGAAALFLDGLYEPLRWHGVEWEGVLVGVGDHAGSTFTEDF